LRRLIIEKALNQQGYHCISPVVSYDELVQLTRYAITPFDLLIINGAMQVRAGMDLEKFCQDEPSIRNVLIYNERASNPPSLAMKSNLLVKATLSKLPDSESIRYLMTMIDPDPEETFHDSLGSPGLGLHVIAREGIAGCIRQQ